MLLFLITYPFCYTARLTLYEREVLAPGAGHHRASGLISNKVIRQTGGAYRQGHGGTREGKQSGRGNGKGEGDCGTGPFLAVWVCSPGGPLLCWTGMQRADNHARGWIDVGNKMKGEKQHMAIIPTQHSEKMVCSLSFGPYNVFDSYALFITCRSTLFCLKADWTFLSKQKEIRKKRNL